MRKDGTGTVGVTVFSKPNCSFCDKAKALLDEKEVKYAEIDVTSVERDALVSIYASGRTTAPQIFIGGHAVGGADDLARLDATGALDRILLAANSRSFAVTIDNLTDDELRAAVVDVSACEFIDESDGTKSKDPEEVPLLYFYKMFFGWWPNCYFYLHRYPEAYKSFIYSTLMSVAGGQAKELLGEDLLCAVAYATSEAQGCGYCQVHTAATTDHSLGLVQQFRATRDGESVTDSPFGELDLILAKLAGAASTNDVTPELIDAIKKMAPEKADEYIKAVGQIASVFGFLNTFNDLTSVEIEGGWNNQVQSAFTVEMGKHAIKSDSTQNPDNLNFELPPLELSFPAMIAKYESIVGDDPAAYMKQYLGIAPNWLKLWYEPYQKRHAYMYVSLMGRDGPSAKISAELKHLMARVAAIMRDHDYLSAVEGFMAAHAGGGDDRAVARVRYCYDAANGDDEARAYFNSEEQAALAIAAASARIPLITLSKDIEPLRRNFDQDEIVQLFSTCGVAGSIQRWCAVAKPQYETEVISFYKLHDLPLSSADYKFSRLLLAG